MIRNARADFINKKLADVSDNPHKFCSEMNKLIKYKPETNKFELTNTDNTPIPSNETANYINNFFATIGPNRAKNFSYTTPTHTERIVSTTLELEFNEINENDLYN